MMMPFNEPVDISKSIFICNVFHFLFAAAKASLYPFVTLYLRQLGFTGMQTGLIMGGKTLIAFVTAPIWSRCAVKGYKRRTTLIFSIIMLSAMYLTMTIVPGRFGDFESCALSLPNTTTTSVATEIAKVVDKTKTSHVVTPQNYATTQSHIDNVTNKTFTTNEITTAKSRYETSTFAPFTIITPSTVHSTEISSAPFTSPTSTSRKFVSLPPGLVAELNRLMTQEHLSDDEVLQLKPAELIRIIQNSPVDDKNPYLSFLRERNDHEIVLLLDSFKNKLKLEKMNLVSTTVSTEIRRKRNSVLNETWTVVKNKVQNAAKTIEELSHQLFFVMFGIMLIGEIFSSPVEKIADDAWYDFLDEIDYLDNYGKHRLWSAIAYILFPIIATVLVDHTPCSIGFNVNHMAIHFYMFSGLLGLTLIVALFYPMPSSSKRKYVSKVLHGFSILFCKCRNFTYVLCLLVMGLCFSTTNYLFWVVSDIAASELPMGLAVAVAAFSELPMLLLSESLTKRFSHAGMVSVAMFSLAIRLVYYSFLGFMNINWAVVPIELLYAVSHTCMWWAVLSNPDFSFSNAVERSVRSILSSVYFGIGFGFGSLLSGLIYDYFGATVLFRGASILAVAWSVVFIIIQRFIPKESKVRYSKLLQGDDDDDDSDESSRNLEHDWLEQALRDR